MIKTEPKYHINRKDWTVTPDGNPRGYIQAEKLTELWFHIGTACNLSCSFCLEGSKPGDTRLGQITFEEAKPFIDEALTMGVKQFSFTGGEPFLNRDMIKILDYALDSRPCHVLTNGTAPFIGRKKEIFKLKDKRNPLSFRISLDSHIPEIHDKERGEGNFKRALDSLGEIFKEGFEVSIARQESEDEDTKKVNLAYQEHVKSRGVNKPINIVSFPDFQKPGSIPNVPYVTENCMTQYKDEKARSEFMCNFSKMVLKKDGKMRVYACTLVDDDPDYDLGGTLKESMEYRVMLKHHRCYSCFAYGASCSET